jgi:hypothetical protein
MDRRPERRVSLVRDRRHRPRGGRRQTDDPLADPAEGRACPACQSGRAAIVPAPNGALDTLTYRCAACGHQFTEPT